MADYRSIMTLVFKGRSYREIVDAVSCSHRDVATARKAITQHGIDAQRLAEMSDTELSGLFPDGRAKVSSDYDLPDFTRVASSMRLNRHFTLLQAWRGYVGSASDRRKYGYSQYCHLFDEFAARNDLVATLHHEPGRAMFVDWAGDTIPLVDAAGGRTTPAYLFVAVLPFSGCVYCRAFIDMRMDAWIAAHVGAFELFGGVAQILVPDNASTATHRKKRGDAARFVNERYRQMADHYGTAIVPARVKKPRDKAGEEATRQGCCGVGGQHGEQAGDRLPARRDVDDAGRAERGHRRAGLGDQPRPSPGRRDDPFRAVHRRGGAGPVGVARRAVRTGGMEGAQSRPKLPRHRRLPALLCSLPACRECAPGAADLLTCDGVRRATGRRGASTQDGPQGPVLHRSWSRPAAAPRC